jgi:secreted trypsin-like serine protease
MSCLSRPRGAALGFLAALLGVVLATGPAHATAGPDRPAIVGGSVAKAGKWPFVVALVQADQPDNFTAQFCAGTLIDESWVVTAAHCVEDATVDDLEVLVGTQNLRHGGWRVDLADIRIHPRYDTFTSDFDIAVLRLAEPVKSIRPVRMLSEAGERLYARPWSDALTVGWGDTSSGWSSLYPTRLHEVAIDLIPTPRCNARDAYDGSITGRMLCAGELDGGRDSCQGDSGGPLMVRGVSGRFDRLAGLVSWGEGCAAKGRPGVYTRISVTRDWVRSIVRRDR